MSVISPKLFVAMMALMTLMGLVACDPCREAAEKICECQGESEEDIRRCKSGLNAAKLHEFFKIARDPKVCERVLDQQCECPQLLDKNDEKCGFFRRDLSEN